MTFQHVLQSKWTLAGLIAAIVALPNLGKGLASVAYLVNTPEVAYAAKGQAEDTAQQFQEYLSAQRAYTEALNDYTKQLQQQQAPPPNAVNRLWDAEAKRYYCEDGEQSWWVNERGDCE